MRVLVTGGRGFIATVTRQALEGHGHTAVCFDRRDGQDVLDLEAVDKAVRDVEAVIHLAGHLGTSELFGPGLAEKAIDVNVKGTLHVLRTCEQHAARIVLITMPDCWVNPYQATKRCARDLALSWHRHRGLPVSFVRAFNVFGAGQKVHGVRKIVPTFARAAWQGKPIPVWGDGQQVVDLVHVSDVARVLVAALAFGGGEVLDAGTGVPHTVNEVARMVWGRAQPDRPLLVEYAPMRAGEDDHTIVVAKGDGWDLPGVAGLRPEFRPEELAATVDWYRTERP